jgi:hypothetical protein
MKKILTMAAAVLTSVAIAGAAQAGPGGKGPSGGSFKGTGGFKPTGGIKTPIGTSQSPFKGVSPFKPSHVSSPLKVHSPLTSHGLGHGKLGYHLTFGKKFSHGFCYHGKHHCHWSYSCWWPKYGCNAYWCPSACCYYYWCEPAGCYYPISYIAVAPPTQVIVIQSTTPSPVQLAGPATGLPEGIPPLPQ